MEKISRPDGGSLKGYIDLGTSIIKKLRGTNKDEEMLGEVIHALIKADARYEQEGKNWECSLRSHRLRQASFAIKTLERNRKNKAYVMLYDNHEVIDKFWWIDLIDYLESRQDEIKINIFVKRYLYNMTLEELANEYQKSPETIRKILNEKLL
jgi:DNA-directed RNA polymerase sigma subunit (sigma70/sigma32)